MAVDLGDVIRMAERSQLDLFEYMWRKDQEALGRLQYQYLLAFEESALSYVYHNPETKRTINVPASGLRFAVQLKSGSSYYFALENDPPLTRWFMVVSRFVSVYYVARISTDHLMWTWFYFFNQITDVALDMYIYDATVISPLPIATDLASTSIVQGRSFGTAYQTNSTLSRTLPNLIEEVLDFLLQRWYVVIASVKKDLWKEIQKEKAAFVNLGIQTGRVAGKLSEIATGYIGTGIQRASQITTDLSQAFSEQHLKATMEEVRQTEQYNDEVTNLYNALKDIDATAVVSSPDIESVRRNAVDFYKKHDQKTIGTLLTLATIMLVKRNQGQVSSAGRAVVLGTCALANTVLKFMTSKTLGAIGVVVNIYNTFKGARSEKDIASMMNLLSIDGIMDNGVEERSLVTVPVSKTKIAAVISTGLVTVRYLYANGYLGMLDTSISFNDALDLTVTTALPVLPASIVFWTTSQFLNPGPTTAFAVTTYFLGLGSITVKTLYQRLDEKKQKEVDEKISDALQRTIAAVPKIPEAIGRAADALPGAALVVGGLLVLSSFGGGFGALGTTIKEKQRSTVLKRKRKQ